MKTAIISCVLVLLLIISSLIIFTVYGQNTRQNELEDSLSTAVEQTLENLKIKKAYSIDNKEEFIADFLENLIVSIESDSALEIKILNVDIEKGLFDVYVTETFNQPNGSTKSISCRKTAILEEYFVVAPKYYAVQFMTTRDGNDEDFVEFKKYQICEGSYLIAPPTTPEKEGYAFVGWSLEKPSSDDENPPTVVDIDALDGTLEISENLTYYAVFAKTT